MMRMLRSINLTMRNRELLQKIDKRCAVNGTNLENLKDIFSEHKQEEEPRLIRIEAAVLENAKHCPESGHIEIQNGKIDDMTIVLKSVKLLVSIILVAGTLISIILGVLKYASGEECPYLYEQQSDRIQTIDVILKKMNNSSGARELNTKFSCIDKNADEPVLKIELRSNCLECKNCKEFLELTYPHFNQISKGWFKWFGSNKVAIYNRDNELKYTVNKLGLFTKYKEHEEIY